MNGVGFNILLSEASTVTFDFLFTGHGHCETLTVTVDLFFYRSRAL